MRSRRGWVSLGMALGLIGLGAWGAEPDPEEVRRRMEIYMREEKPAPVPKPVSKPAPKPAPRVDHDREAWQSAEKCGTTACFRAYLENYPKGRYARMARARLEPESDAEPAVVTERPTPAARRTDRRFTDNGNGTVTDNHSRLIWLKNANCFGRQDWSTAMTLARRLSSGDCGLRDGSGAGQWRLPSKEEWETLIDKNASAPMLPAGHLFTGVQSDEYWSSTTYRDSTGDARIVTLNVDYVGPLAKVSASNSVWPVRGGR